MRGDAGDTATAVAAGPCRRTTKMSVNLVIESTFSSVCQLASSVNKSVSSFS
jgi:hypothetical protein